MPHQKQKPQRDPILAEAGLPENFQPLDAAPIIPGQPLPGATQGKIVVVSDGIHDITWAMTLT
jgi:hypothetical protein